MICRKKCEECKRSRSWPFIHLAWSIQMAKRQTNLARYDCFS